MHSLYFLVNPFIYPVLTKFGSFAGGCAAGFVGGLVVVVVVVVGVPPVACNCLYGSTISPSLINVISLSSSTKSLPEALAK